MALVLLLLIQCASSTLGNNATEAATSTSTAAPPPRCPEMCLCGNAPLPGATGLRRRPAKSLSCGGLPPAELASPTTEMLFVSNATLRRLDFWSMRHLHNLLVLDMRSVGVSDLGGTGKTVPKLRLLDLSGNNLHVLQRFAFRDFPELRLLNLSGNGLHSVAPAALVLPQVAVLDLRHNKLSVLNAYFFSDLPSLQELYLADNALSRVPSFVFPGSLDRLDLSGNHISRVEEGAFDGINVSSVLDLSRNALRRVPNAALKRLGSVRALVLDDNPLAALSARSVVGLAAEVLLMRHIRSLSIIHRDAFINLPELRELRLSSNVNLTYVHPQSFVNVPRLHTIDLSGTALYILEQELLGSAPALRSLLLENNTLHCHCSLGWLRNLTGRPVVCRDNATAAPIALPQLQPAQQPPACAPYIIPLFPLHFSETLGNNASFHCRALGQPALKVHWFSRSGERLFNNQCSSREPRLCVWDHALTVLYLHAEDAGRYTCVARNAEGSDSRAVELQVRDVRVLLLPLTVTSTFVTLAWNMSSAVTNSYTLRVQDESPQAQDDPRSVTFTGGLKMHSYTVHGLRPRSRYTFTLAIKREEYLLVIGSTTVTTREDAFLVSLGIERSYLSIILVSVLVGAALAACLGFCGLRCWRQRLRLQQAAALRKSDSAYSGRELVSSPGSSPGITYISLSDDRCVNQEHEPSLDDNLISFT